MGKRILVRQLHFFLNLGSFFLRAKLLFFFVCVFL